MKENFRAADGITGGNGSVQLTSNISVPTIDDTKRHTAVVTISRLDSQTVRISASIDGFVIKAVDSGSSIITSFDEIAIRSGLSNVDVIVDNVALQAL
ncbi:MAG: hypothetical protein RMX96_01495 [Nostoc sp. ChiSLP02]|nr:hypothetical protein [Nostoc sp. DedSLP05]MDZ8102922.1 hypothetical protein [Nostoc sp. DedSLP01]MDZ8183522.1 hypothetical protein [Nostoc sp. ChiSLP02]